MRFVFAALFVLSLVSPVSAQESKKIGTWSVSIAPTVGLGRSNKSIASAMLSAGYLNGCLLCDNDYGPFSLRGGPSIQITARRRISTRTHVRALASNLTLFKTSAYTFTPDFREVSAHQRISTFAVLVGVNRAEPSLRGKHVHPWMAAGPALYRPSIVSGLASTQSAERITRIGGALAAGLSLIAGGTSLEVQTDYRRAGTHDMAPIVAGFGGGPVLPVPPVDWNHFTVSVGLGLRW